MEASMQAEGESVPKMPALDAHLSEPPSAPTAIIDDQAMASPKPGTISPSKPSDMQNNQSELLELVGHSKFPGQQPAAMDSGHLLLETSGVQMYSTPGQQVAPGRSNLSSHGQSASTKSRSPGKVTFSGSNESPSTPTGAFLAQPLTGGYASPRSKPVMNFEQLMNNKVMGTKEDPVSELKKIGMALPRVQTPSSAAVAEQAHMSHSASLIENLQGKPESNQPPGYLVAMMEEAERGKHQKSTTPSSAGKLRGRLQTPGSKASNRLELSSRQQSVGSKVEHNDHQLHLLRRQLESSADDAQQFYLQQALNMEQAEAEKKAKRKQADVEPQDYRITPKWLKTPNQKAGKRLSPSSDNARNRQTRSTGITQPAVQAGVLSSNRSGSEGPPSAIRVPGLESHRRQKLGQLHNKRPGSNFGASHSLAKQKGRPSASPVTHVSPSKVIDTQQKSIKSFHSSTSGGYGKDLPMFQSVYAKQVSKSHGAGGVRRSASVPPDFDMHFEDDKSRDGPTILGRYASLDSAKQQYTSTFSGRETEVPITIKEADDDSLTYAVEQGTESGTLNAQPSLPELVTSTSPQREKSFDGLGSWTKAMKDVHRIKKPTFMQGSELQRLMSVSKERAAKVKAGQSLSSVLNTAPEDVAALQQFLLTMQADVAAAVKYMPQSRPGTEAASSLTGVLNGTPSSAARSASRKKNRGASRSGSRQASNHSSATGSNFPNSAQNEQDTSLPYQQSSMPKCFDPMCGPIFESLFTRTNALHKDIYDHKTTAEQQIKPAYPARVVKGIRARNSATGASKKSTMEQLLGNASKTEDEQQALEDEKAMLLRSLAEGAGTDVELLFRTAKAQIQFMEFREREHKEAVRQLGRLMHSIQAEGQRRAAFHEAAKEAARKQFFSERGRGYTFKNILGTKDINQLRTDANELSAIPIGDLLREVLEAYIAQQRGGTAGSMKKGLLQGGEMDGSEAIADDEANFSTAMNPDN